MALIPSFIVGTVQRGAQKRLFINCMLIPPFSRLENLRARFEPRAAIDVAWPALNAFQVKFKGLRPSASDTFLIFLMASDVVKLGKAGLLCFSYLSETQRPHGRQN